MINQFECSYMWKYVSFFVFFRKILPDISMASWPTVLDGSVGHFWRVYCTVTDKNTVMLLYLIEVMVKKQMEVVIYV